jgi:hypothetical protein
MLNLHLRIKFRAFFVDLFTFEKTVQLPSERVPLELLTLVVSGLQPLRGKVLINERGVLLEIL